jgi:hypothetical protein
VAWPSSSVVARAYVDQLNRGKGIQAERARAVTTALERADKIRSAKDRDAAAAREQLESLASQLEGDAGAASGANAARLRSLAATLKGRTATMR